MQAADKKDVVEPEWVDELISKKRIEADNYIEEPSRYLTQHSETLEEMKYSMNDSSDIQSNY